MENGAKGTNDGNPVLTRDLERTRGDVNRLQDAVTNLAINDRPSNEKGAEIRGWIKGKLRDIEGRREFFTGPLNEQVKRINALFKGLTEPLSLAMATLDAKMLDYARELARKAEEEKARQAAARAEARELGQGVAPEAPVAEPEKTTQTAYGTTTVKKRWTFRLVDFARVPDAYKTLGETAVNAAIRQGVREIPGLEIYEEEMLATRTK